MFFYQIDSRNFQLGHVDVYSLFIVFKGYYLWLDNCRNNSRTRNKMPPLFFSLAKPVPWPILHYDHELIHDPRLDIKDRMENVSLTNIYETTGHANATFFHWTFFLLVPSRFIKENARIGNEKWQFTVKSRLPFCTSRSIQIPHIFDNAIENFIKV